MTNPLPLANGDELDQILDEFGCSEAARDSGEFNKESDLMTFDQAKAKIEALITKRVVAELEKLLEEHEQDLYTIIKARVKVLKEKE